MSRFIFVFLFTSISFYTFSQEQQLYPQHYFHIPLNIPPSLAGNFGDLRTNHYHMGLDLRTQQRENLPVSAAADGYVSHIRVGAWGYGRAIYITHPNGFTTVYGHLNKFYTALENYLHNQQYITQSWEQDIDFSPTQFPVKSGQFIAWSGNTGGSEGPHLHFEIRDSGLANGYSRNPLLFGLNIPDHVPPALYRVGIFDRSESIYEHSPRVFSLRKKASAGTTLYTPTDTILKVPTGKFSFGVSMEDKMDNSFSFGIYKADLYLDGNVINSFKIEDCIYGDSRYINAGIDYVARYSGGSYMQHLSRLPGNHSPFYDAAVGDGVLELEDDSIHHIEIEVSDVAGNTSVLRFAIQRNNGVLFSTNRFAGTVVQKLLPNQPSVFENASVEAAWDKNAFYDTVQLRYSVATAPADSVSALHSIGDYHLPVHTPYMLRIKPTVALTDGLKNKVMMVLRSGKRKDAQPCAWQDDWAAAQWTYFGDFYLKLDTIPPTVRAVNVHEGASFVKAQHFVFDAKDETGDLQSFNGYIDNRWIVFRQKGDRYSYDFDERCLPGAHVLKVVAMDLAGNTTMYQYNFVNGATE